MFKLTTYKCDNIEVLKSMNSDLIDLIYIDPPFNKNQIFKGSYRFNMEHIEFKDFFNKEDIKESWVEELKNHNLYELISVISRIADKSMYFYLVYMSIRLIESYRVMKDTASLYFHCDYTVSHYIKLILDSIFGRSNFNNEIIWRRTSAKNYARHKYSVVTDSIFFYSKTKNYYFDRQYIQRSTKEIETYFNAKDADGRRWSAENLQSPILTKNNVYSYKASNGITYHPPRNGWMINIKKMKIKDEQNELVFPKNEKGLLRYKNYADKSKGKLVQNLWDDFYTIGSSSKERTGYPTQKPIKLLNRIISASCKPGGVVLDPFAGSGVTIKSVKYLNETEEKYKKNPLKCIAIDFNLNEE